MTRKIETFTIAAMLLGFAGIGEAGDWRQFRGNETTAVAADELIPQSWSETENVAWKADLAGRGLSGPIVVGDRVVVTSSSGYRQDRLHITCFAVKTGEKLWERQFWAIGRTMSHPKTCNAAPTPTSDGQRIFALYSSADLICVDLDGNLQWVRGLTIDYPNASNSLGMAQSPVMAGDTLVTQIENDSQSIAVGIDPVTGLTRWSQERPKRANWTSPVVLPGKTPSDDLVLLQSSAGLAAVRPATGEVVWKYEDGASTIPSSTIHSGTIFVPSRGITALQIPEGSSNPEIVWRMERLNPGTASPIVHQNRVMILNNAGVLVAADTKSGETLWQQRLEGPFSSSPVIAGDLLVVFNERGLGQVVKIGEKGDIVSKNDLAETILCTPAVAGGAIYVRSDGHLWKLAAAATGGE